MRLVPQVSRLLAAAFVLASASTAFAADDGAWTVSKSSGEVWLTSTGAEPASLKQEELLKPGDTVRTGRNGRVLLKRGEETMLISPNSVVGMPAQKAEGLSTTIVQQAGSILLEVEKRNVKHFEVETPYLAAVVKGTQFRVTVNAGSTSVDVIRGQVEVADFRSGQIAQVMPGQHATAFTHGKLGLSLSGSGTFSPIEHGKPRAPTVEPVNVRRAGLSTPITTANGTVTQRQTGAHTARPGVTRISSSMGEVRLNFHRVTHGLARDASSSHGASRNAVGKETIWSSSGSTAPSTVAGAGQSNTATGSANSAASVGTGAVTGVTTTVAAVTGSGNNGNGNGNGNGNSNKNGNKNGDGNESGNGNGNGNRNGHEHGHSKNH